MTDKKNFHDKQVSQHYNLLLNLKKASDGKASCVWKAEEKSSHDIVAVRKYANVFSSTANAERTFKEIMFQQEFGDHENFVRILDIIKAENDMDLYLISEYVEADLLSVLKSGILTDSHKSYVAFQLLRGIDFLHSAGIVHRGIKPSSILISSDCHIKLSDFSLSGVAGSVVSLADVADMRWYNAPEILLGHPTCTRASDIWSIACVIGELVLNKPLLPGFSSTYDQLRVVLQITGIPKEEEITAIENPTAEFLVKQLSVEKHSLKDLYPEEFEKYPQAFDLLASLLVFNFNDRPSAEQALKHPYFEEWAKSSGERLVCPPVTINLDDSYTVSDYRGKVFDALLLRKKQRDDARTSAILATIKA